MPSYSFDASAMIYAWDNYPQANFPNLWEWIKKETKIKHIIMLNEAYNEVNHKSPELAEFLHHANIHLDKPENELVQMANQIKEGLGIQGNMYGQGVGEIDIFIIAHTKLQNRILVTQEAQQYNKPKEKKKYKIPAVCEEPYVDISHRSFLQYIKDSNRVF